jgi:hypothetical protein
MAGGAILGNSAWNFALLGLLAERGTIKGPDVTGGAILDALGHTVMPRCVTGDAFQANCTQEQCHKVSHFHDWKRTYTGSSKNNAIKFLTFLTGNEHIMDLPRTMP